MSKRNTIRSHVSTTAQITEGGSYLFIVITVSMSWFSSLGSRSLRTIYGKYMNANYVYMTI